MTAMRAVRSVTKSMKASSGAATAAARNGHVRYSVSEVARLSDLSASMVRWLERENLVHPGRTSGGHRAYGPADVDRLRQIAYLRRVERLNAAAIRRELGAAQPAKVEPDVDPALGRRLRALRAARNMSLDALSKRTGLSISFLSAVERGRSGISLANLIKVADVYDTSVPGLYAKAKTTKGYLIPAERHSRYKADRGRVEIEDFIVRPGGLQVVRYVISPGGESEEAYAHSGQDFIHVLTGSLTVWIEETERYLLKVGDSLNFPGGRLHRWRNEGNGVATLLWINTPGGTEDRERPPHHEERKRRRHPRRVAAKAPRRSAARS